MASNKVSIPGHFPLYVAGSHRCRCPAHQEQWNEKSRQRRVHEGDPWHVAATPDRTNENDHDDTIDTILELLHG